MGKSKKDNFLLNIKHAKRIRGLSDEDAGKLLKSIFSFAEGEDGEEYELSERADLIFDYIKEEITEASEKYEKTCEKRKNAVKKRWKDANDTNDTNDTNVYKCIEEYTSDTDNDSEYDNGHNSLKESMCVDARTREEEKSSVPCGLFGNVYLTGEEIKALESEIGEEKLKKAIMKLSTEIEKTGKYKSEKHAATIRSWVIEAIDEAEVRELERGCRRRRASSVRDGPAEKAEKAGFDFELEEIFENP